MASPPFHDTLTAQRPRVSPSLTAHLQSRPSPRHTTLSGATGWGRWHDLPGRRAYLRAGQARPPAHRDRFGESRDRLHRWQHGRDSRTAAACRHSARSPTVPRTAAPSSSPRRRFRHRGSSGESGSDMPVIASTMYMITTRTISSGIQPQPDALLRQRRCRFVKCCTRDPLTRRVILPLPFVFPKMPQRIVPA